MRLFGLRLCRLAVAGLLTTLAVAPAAAQQADSLDRIDRIVRLPTLTVVATRHPVLPADAPGLVISLDAAGDTDLRGAETLADVLGEGGGLAIRTYGSSGLATLSIRGAGPSQSALLLDGFPLRNAQLGQFDLSLLPAALLGRVDILAGSASALYGSDAIAGVVYASSTAALGAPTSVSLGSGSFGERFASVSTGFVGRRFAAASAIRLARTDGDFAYTNTALLGAPEVRRENADRQDFAAMTVLSAQGARYEADATLIGIRTTRGLPGVANATPTNERQGDTILRATAGVKMDAGGFQLAAATMFDHSRIRYENPTLGIDQTGIVSTTAIRLKAGRGLRTLVLEADRSVADHPEFDGKAKRLNVSSSGSATLRAGPLTAYPALRFDAFDARGVRSAYVLSPRVGFNIRPQGGAFVFKASGGRAFRMPTFNDLFWREAGATGNPDLAPERSWSAEAGPGWFADNVSFEFAAFVRRTRDQIVWVADETQRWAPENIGLVAARGVQAHGRYARTFATRHGDVSTSARLGYTWAHARDITDAHGPETYLRYVPAHVGSSGLDVGMGAVRVGLDVSASSSRPITTDGRARLPGHVVLDANVGASIMLGRFDTDLRVGVRNLLDERYSVIEGYPMPPRHIRIQLTTTIR